MNHTFFVRQRLTRNKTSRHAFTLIEMLVAAVVSTVLIVLVAQMANSALQTVGLASGRMVSAAKLHDLRSLLASDLALVPDPALGTHPDQPTLRIDASNMHWTLTLIQPDATAPAWKRVTYHWQKTSQSLQRQEQVIGSLQTPEPPQTLVTGLIDWQVKCLAGPSQNDGPRWWDDDSRKPVALICKARLSGVREEGQQKPRHLAAEKGREYEWRLTIAEGGDATEP